MKKLTDSEITQALKDLSDWEQVDNAIKKRYTFPTFSDALIFANRLGEHAEEVNHHPELCVGWGYCSITLTTHDVDGVSSKDVSFAEEAERLFDKESR